MLRIALLAAVAVIALPAAAEAAVLPSVSGDTLTVTGDGAPDNIAVRVIAPGTLQIAAGTATFNFNRSTFTKLAIRSGGGADAIQIEDALTETTTIETGPGADTVVGGPASELIATGDDGDQVAPGAGDDRVILGAGDDTVFQGDGFDVVEGEAGSDRLLAAGTAESEEFTVQGFDGKARIARDTRPSTTDSTDVTDFLQMNGSGGNDRFDVLPVGSRTRVTRGIENVNLDLGDLERVDLLPGPGGDIVRVGDLSGTDTNRVDVNLMVARGQIGGDNLIDRVFVDGTFGSDTINVNGAGPDVRVTGLANITTVRGTDPELDRLHVDTKLGIDALTVTGTTNQLIGFTSA